MYTQDKISDIFKSQKDFFLSDETKPITFRRAQLKKLYKLIKDQEADIYKALKEDLKKPEFESFLSENGFVLSELEYTLKRLKRWMKPKRLPSSALNFPSSSFMMHEPYGVNLIISPWNYPFQLSIVPLIGAISAGNCAIIKPSELTPTVSRLMAAMINDNFDSGYIHVVEGGAAESQHLLKEKFDFIFYTGGEKVGKIIAEAAAKNLIPVTLELGGKSPCIVDREVNVKLAARRIAWGKFLNAGQTCIAPDYIYVHEEIEDAFKLALKTEYDNMQGSDPLNNEDMTHIVNEGHFNRVSSLIDEKKVYQGGTSNKDSLFIDQTIMENVTWNDSVMQEEIFGPVLPILTYSDIDDVIKTIKEREKPLACYIFTNKKAFHKKIINSVSFGGGAINDTLTHLTNPHIPFGGVGLSGYGAYHGVYNFETFSHKKGILKKGNWLDIPLRYAPYKAKLKWAKLAYKYNIEI